MQVSRLIKTTPKERDWLYANVPGCWPVGHRVVVPNFDTVDDMLYGEIRDSGTNISRQRFFRKLRLKMLTGDTMHEPSHETVEMSEWVTGSGPFDFSPNFKPDEYAFEEDEELL